MSKRFPIAVSSCAVVHVLTKLWRVAVHCSRGNALRDFGQRERALASYDRAVELQLGLAMAFFNRGIALEDG